MSNAYVIKSNGKVLPIKNLGWLARNAKHVQEIGFNKGDGSGDGKLWAKGSKGNVAFTYFCDWASFQICIGWLRSRSWFQGVSFSIATSQDDYNSRQMMVIGDEKFKSLDSEWFGGLKGGY